MLFQTTGAFRGWRIIIHHLCHRFVQVLLTLLRFGVAIEGLARDCSPDQFVIRRSVHVYPKAPLVDRRWRFIPSWNCGKFLCYKFPGLIANEQISRIGIDFLEALLSRRDVGQR